MAGGGPRSYTLDPRAKLPRTLAQEVWPSGKEDNIEQYGSFTGPSASQGHLTTANRSLIVPYYDLHGSGGSLAAVTHRRPGTPRPSFAII